MIYLFVILGSMLAITAVNALLGAALWPTLGATVLLTAAVIAVDGVFALIIRRLPKKWFSYEGRLFRIGRREERLYRALRVGRLAAIVPDLGCFTDFPKRSLREPQNPVYTERYLLESAYGIVIHAVNIFDGVLILPILAGYAWSVALPVALVNAVLSLLPILLLRSNFPRVARLHRRNLRKCT